ncbi:radical SAM protein [Candidatus Pacearchaeota archaeon]|nr:radical SAM protein [Candidatus Pacearchaeota archaeon]
MALASNLSIQLKQNLFFNVNKNSGRWNFSIRPREISENRTISQLDEWDDLIKTLVVNVTDKCNLNCVYCSRQFARNRPRSMNEELIRKLLKKAADYAFKKKIKITVQFHGGEPMLEFQKIIKSIDFLSENEKSNLRLRIQTNGTLLNKKIMEECKKRDIEIGISLDGRQIENDITRKDAQKKGTFKTVIRALGLIKKYQKDKRCLTVVTNINIKNLDKILEFFGSIGINDVGFLPLYEEPRTRTIKRGMVPDMKNLAKYQEKLFDKWLELLKNKKYKKLNISTFQILIWNLLASNSTTKKFRVNCGVGINSLFIESDGNIWGCGAFSYANELRLGNINNDAFEEIQKNNNYRKFKERITTNVKKCKDCAFQFICGGGCVANGFRQNKNIFDTDIWCEYWDEIIKYILIKIYENPKLIKLIPEYNIKKIITGSQPAPFSLLFF